MKKDAEFTHLLDGSGPNPLTRTLTGGMWCTLHRLRDPNAPTGLLQVNVWWDVKRYGHRRILIVDLDLDEAQEKGWQWVKEQALAARAVQVLLEGGVV